MYWTEKFLRLYHEYIEDILTLEDLDYLDLNPDSPKEEKEYALGERACFEGHIFVDECPPAWFTLEPYEQEMLMAKYDFTKVDDPDELGVINWSIPCEFGPLEFYWVPLPLR